MNGFGGFSGLLAERPDSDIVLIDGTQSWSASRLKEAIAEMERRLVSDGVGPGDRVVLEIPNSAAWVIGAFAVWSIGATVVPIQDYLRSSAPQIVANCAASAVLSVSQDKDEGSVSVVRLPGFKAQPSPEIAAIYFTSGTSGEPAGVMLSESNLLTNAAAVAQALDLRREDRAFLPLSLGYIYGLSVLLSHWTAGGAVILERGFAYPAAGLRRAAETGATVFYGVSSHYDAICRWGGVEAGYAGPLRLLAQAGDRMPPDLTRRLTDIFGPDREVRSMYGQTEASPRIACAKRGDALRKPGTVGKAIPGVEIRIIDESGAAVPAGQPGEIAVRGAGVMLGYWKNAELTRERIQDGWLRTQDIGRLDADGDLYIEGRLSDSFKVHGLWVLPGKIERVCLELSGVVEARAESFADETTGLSAIRVWLRSASGSGDEAALNGLFKERLQIHERPSKIFWTEQLPGKATKRRGAH